MLSPIFDAELLVKLLGTCCIWLIVRKRCNSSLLMRVLENACSSHICSLMRRRIIQHLLFQIFIWFIIKLYLMEFLPFFFNFDVTGYFWVVFLVYSTVRTCPSHVRWLFHFELLVEVLFSHVWLKVHHSAPVAFWHFDGATPRFNRNQWPLRHVDGADLRQQRYF